MRVFWIPFRCKKYFNFQRECPSILSEKLHNKNVFINRNLESDINSDK